MRLFSILPSAALGAALTTQKCYNILFMLRDALAHQFIHELMNAARKSSNFMPIYAIWKSAASGRLRISQEHCDILFMLCNAIALQFNHELDNADRKC